MAEEQIQNPITPEVPQAHSNRLLIGVITVALLILIGGGVFYWLNKNAEKPAAVFPNTELYSFGDEDFRFSFRYPTDYCTSQDIGTVTVLYKDDCVRTASQGSGDGIDVTTWPDIDGKATNDKEFLENLKIQGKYTGEQREIA